MAILNSEINKHINHLVLDATRAFNGLQMESISAVEAYKKLKKCLKNSGTKRNVKTDTRYLMRYLIQ